MKSHERPATSDSTEILFRISNVITHGKTRNRLVKYFS